MTSGLHDVISLLELERIDDNIFRGESRDIGAPQVFGGQIVGQALSAAHQTVDDRRPHSLHAYFLRPGDFHHPVIYQVERARDGQTYSNRRVVAIQHGRPILNMTASFHTDEPAWDHQAEMPSVPGPEGLQNSTELGRAAAEHAPEKMRRLLMHSPPFEFRPVEPPKFLEPSPRPAAKHVWMKAWEPLPEDEALHRHLLTYVSDYELLGTATFPHELDFRSRRVQMASLDHALWFHRPCRVDDWLLYACDSPNSFGGRGFSRGQIFTQKGELVASVAQEGVIRPRPKRS